MATSRRKFIKVGTISALVAGIPLKAAARELFNPAAHLLSSNNVADGTLNMRAFARHLNSKFRIHHGNAKTTQLKLVEVKDLRTPSAANQRRIDSAECFSAVFLGASRSGLRQNTYIVEHGSLGKFSLLLVPVDMSKNQQYYEAIFNRLH